MTQTTAKKADAFGTASVARFAGATEARTREVMQQCVKRGERGVLRLDTGAIVVLSEALSTVLDYIDASKR